jgi:holo-[acyl-carrier protein] synthase
MLRIGVDMIEIERVRRAIERHGARFFARFFTAQECEQCQGIPARFAVRFAAKEAAAKALGTGIGDVRWVDIEVWSDGRRCPHLILHGTAAQLAEQLGLRSWQISLSHTDEYAVAFVVATSEE